MATMQRTPPSNIPIISPRPTRNGHPGSFSLPQLNSPPSSAAPAVSATPVQPNSTAKTSTSRIPGGSLRTLRSLLPFGPGKQSNPSANGSTSGARSTFESVRSVRRSMTGERKNSVSEVRTTEAPQTAIVSIDSSSSDRSHTSTLRKASENRELPPLPVLTPGPPLGTDLSTIIEADTSGMSRHNSGADQSQEITAILNDASLSNTTEPTPAISQSSLPSADVDVDASPPPGRDVSVQDLSMSVMNGEVVKDYAAAADWLSGPDGRIVDGSARSLVAEPVERKGTDLADPNVSFNLSALDPDLAALLSPNRISNNDSSVRRSVDAIPPPLLTPNSPAQFVLEDEPPSPRFHPAIRRSSLSIGDSSPKEPRTLGIQSSPARTSSPSSSSRPISISSLPRLARHVPGFQTPSGSKQDLSGLPSSRTSPDRPTTAEDDRHMSSSENLSHRQPPSPLSGSGYSRTGDSALRKPSQSFLVAPSRTYASKRPMLSRSATASVTTDSDSVSPSTMTMPTHSIPAHNRLLEMPQASHDATVRLDMTERDRTLFMRSRKRSQSMEGSQASPDSAVSYQTPSISRPSTAMSNRPTAEWLGPRTAKAFAAAGLLDFEKEGRSATAPVPSRYGSLRGSSERDVRSPPYVTSRMGFSDVNEMSTSWGGRNRSASRSATTPEAGAPLMESPTFTSTTTTHRTNFSNGSTAPTSISAVSSSQPSALQMLKEKHDVETEALLAALSDSQRTTKILREENGELRERIGILENRLDDAMQQMLQYQAPPPSAPASTHTMRRPYYDRMPRTVSADGLHKRTHSRPHNPAHVPTPQRHGLPDRNDNSSPVKSVGKRLSTTSSVFPNPPSNMSMLMQEEAVPVADRSYSSRSPHSPATALSNNSTRHGHSKSLSSGGNISPATANFSMSEMNGSPGSLFLRPEHEMHLGDMTSIDIGLHLTDEDREDG